MLLSANIGWPANGQVQEQLLLNLHLICDCVKLYIENSDVLVKLSVTCCCRIAHTVHCNNNCSTGLLRDMENDLL